MRPTGERYLQANPQWTAVLAALMLLAGAAGAANESPPPPCDGPRVLTLTIDDLPAQRGEQLEAPRLESLTDGILAALERANAPAIGFVNEKKLYQDGELVEERVHHLERWLAAGHELGNHTFSHPDLHRVPLPVFLDEIDRGDPVTRRLAATHGATPRYFRHPFLHTGRDLDTRAAVERHLAERGYRVAPVTIDNSEWIFARAFDEAVDRGADELAGRVEEAYLAYMVEMTRFYEGQSCGIVGRLIPQILLLHANSLNGSALTPLLDRLSNLGYRFAPLDEALADPAYETQPDHYAGPAGITWLHRWALTRNLDRTLFAGEPTTPDWVQELAGLVE